MKIALYLLLVALASTQPSGLPAQVAPGTGQAASATTGTPSFYASPSNAPPDAALAESLTTMQAVARKSGEDLARLHIDKWKADSQSKQQAQATAASIQRNLTSAIPELLQRLQAEPGSFSANFKLYRNLNALYDSFSALAESAGAFGPEDQYAPLASDVAQFDRTRHQLAERIDQLAASSDAELARLRAAAKAAAKPASKVVVDDSSRPKPKKKAKPSPSQPLQQ